MSYAQTWKVHTVIPAVFYWLHRPALVTGGGDTPGHGFQEAGLIGHILEAGIYVLPKLLE